MTTNWRDKWRGTTRGVRVILTVEDHGDYLEVFPADGGHYPVYPTGRHSKDRETPHDLLPITPPAAPVPQDRTAEDEAVKIAAHLARNPSEISKLLERLASNEEAKEWPSFEVVADLADLRRDAERCDELHEAMLKLVDLIDARHDLHAVFTIKDSIECAHARSLIGKQTTLDISEGTISIIPYSQEAAQLMIDETVRKLRRVGYVIVADGAALRAVRAMTDQPQDAAADALPDPAE